MLTLPRVITTNRRIARIPHFVAFMAEQEPGVAGWGRKTSGRMAQWLACLLRRRCLLLEDGFLRSVGRQGPLLSMIVDDLGVYYDARSSSRMETAIAEGTNEKTKRRAAALITQWVASCLSKYNHSTEWTGPLPESYVLVADQCFGDLSVQNGLATPACFTAMLDAALKEYPNAQIFVKIHPEVLAGRRKSYLAESAQQRDRVTIIGTECHPLRLIDGASAVYAVTSLIGFEALLRRRHVRCFGMPFYAGWGLTDDALPPPPRRHKASIEDLVHAAFITLARYIDPISGRPWSAEEAIADAAAARSRLLAAPSSTGISAAL